MKKIFTFLEAGLQSAKMFRRWRRRQGKKNIILFLYRIAVSASIAISHYLKSIRKKKLGAFLSSTLALCISSLHNFKWFDVRHSHFSKPFLCFYSSFRLMFICFFFHLRTNLSVCKVLCGCAIILTRVILFSSIYVNVDILSAFHVSTSTPIVIVVAVVLYVFFFSFLIFNFVLASTRLYPSSLCEDFICKN